MRFVHPVAFGALVRVGRVESGIAEGTPQRRGDFGVGVSSRHKEQLGLRFLGKPWVLPCVPKISLAEVCDNLSLLELMTDLASITAFLESYLRHPGFPDYSGAANGLQLENSGRVLRIGAAVDACEVVIDEAVKRGISLLLVHHGLMWDQHCQAFTGARFRKLKRAIQGDLALFSSHLPLDAHPVVGNSAQLAAAIGLGEVTPFFMHKTEPVGMRGVLDVSRAELFARVQKAVGGGAITLCAAGPERVQRVGIVTGGAGSEVATIMRSGVDTFITGEGPHWSYTAAEELGLNVFYAGHYATETFGVKALAAEVSAKFGVPWEFIDHPTGL